MYCLWLDNPGMDLATLGSKLRSPPLEARSVARMIIEAIRAEKLPYERRRLKEVLSIYGVRTGGTYIPQHPYFELARDSGYIELTEKESEKE